MVFATNQNEVQINFFSWLFSRMQEGGIVIMSIVLICGFIVLLLTGRSLLYVKNINPKLTKMIILINSIGLFALVAGVFGQLLQLINTLDYLEFRGQVKAEELAAGLKFTILPTLFGCFIFLISRFFTIMLNWLKPHHKVD
ncbi:MotA/TolQ/ExbB proton channel family protein [Marivirga sp. S37H4]|uniref:MotA/TolQ/ExbB proton channel family protein n=1 Tax=Marivirga aurantiaca TaxID=2802615 RepID=A0A935C8S7_9BACT|nr:MotA/TolQ/ExbB proton channel family protein [Marivirga aurantiaca]MBK6265660.1 MotA/TolQ/ExbB proton channel family protein [Marivirga aurantiaca]